MHLLGRGFCYLRDTGIDFGVVSKFLSAIFQGTENPAPSPMPTRIGRVLEANGGQCHAKKKWTCHRAIVLGIPLCTSSLLSLCSSPCTCQSSWCPQRVVDSAERFIVQLNQLTPWLCACFLPVLMAGPSNNFFSLFAGVSHKSQQAH